MKPIDTVRPARRPRPASPIAAALAAAAAILAWMPAAAQAPADAVLRDFRPTGDFLLEIDGQRAEGAEIYKSERVAAILVVTSKLPPVLLQPRVGSVETVGLMSLARRPDGSIDVLADAELGNAGRFTHEGDDVRFTVGGKRVTLKPKPYLIGLQEAADLLADKPEYARLAGDYRPYEPSIEALKKSAQPVRVRVYFGSWCPACGRLVPPLLKVAEQLEGSKVEFEFYGLPADFQDEPAASADEVHSVPTGVVFAGSREIGRIEGAPAWRIPEATLSDIVAGRSKG
jgi:thiol-disulfide isomerase/thioredoxin